MVVYDFHILRAGVGPNEAKPVLIVDPDDVLSLPVPLERFQAVARERAEVFKRFGSVQDFQALAGRALDRIPLFRELVVEGLFGFPVPERANHFLSV